jgi:hypothetical protein
MATAAATNLRERIPFNFNLPYELTLESSGTEQEGRNGSEFRYFLEGRQIMWIPPEAHALIMRATGGEPIGETFSITRRKTGRGAAEWEVVHHDDSPPDPEPAPPAQRQQAPAPQPTARPAAQPAAANGPMSDTLYTSLCAAIRTAAAAEAFAQSIGRPVAFETSDIRAMAATLYIHTTGGAR